MFAWSAVALAASPCDLSRADGVLQALEEVDADQRPTLASAFLAEACRLPDALRQTLEQVPAVDPAMRSMIAARGAAADPALLLAACTGGPRAFAALAALPVESKRSHLWDACGLERHAAVVDRATFLAATDGEPVLYLLAAQALAPVAKEPVVREALRAIAGAPSPNAPKAPIIPRKLP